MKKIIFITLLICLSGSTYECSGYKPIFSSSTSQFEISDYLIEGDIVLGKKIYLKLYNLSNTKKDQQNVRSISLLINASKNKNATTKNNDGTTSEYKISLNTKIKVTDAITNNNILNQDLNYSLNYKVQDQYFDTVKLEKKSIESLLDKTYQEIFVKLLDNI